jgi:sulfotransferase family protein
MEPLILRAANWIAAAMGTFDPPLSTALMSLAQKRTRLSDFGEWSFEAPLEALLNSYEQEANLSAFGRIAARWDTLRLLSNLLVLRHAEQQNPAILSRSIEKPVFITGLPRSGTSFLHDLLGRDRSNHVVHCWETIYPWPREKPDRRQAIVNRQLAGFARLAPDISTLHPMTADSPQECSEITAHVFTSLRFDTTHYVPSYREWVDSTGHKTAYLFHKRFLQHLQYQNGPGRWILKCPDHVFALDAIRAVYPDARFVFVHRNPLEVLPSVAKLTEVLRRPFTRHVDRVQIGRQVSERWAQGAAILVEASNGAYQESDTVFHIKFQSLVSDPLRSIATIYDHFGIELSADASARIQAVPSTNNEPRRASRSHMEDFALDAFAERRRYRDYMSCFAV